MRGCSDPPTAGTERLVPKLRQGGKSTIINESTGVGIRDVLGSRVFAFLPWDRNSSKVREHVDSQ